jgi:hypothetical protein
MLYLFSSKVMYDVLLKEKRNPFYLIKALCFAKVKQFWSKAKNIILL